MSVQSPELLELPVNSAAAIEFCRHCQTRLSPADPFQGFCCRGCQTVFGILTRGGLESYYRIRESLGEKGHAPASVESRQFKFYDDPDFLKSFTRDRGREIDLYLENAHCSACVWLTEKLPDLLPEVENLRLDLSTGVARVRLTSDQTGFSKVARLLAELGYPPHPVQESGASEQRKRETRRELVRLGVSGMVAGNIMLLAIAEYAGLDTNLLHFFRWASGGLFLPIFFYGAVPFYRGAWGALRAKKVSIDVPIVLGVLVGSLTSFYQLLMGGDWLYFDSISSLVFLMLSTRFLLRKINERSARTTHLMHFVAPSRATRLDANGGKEEVSAFALQAEDRVVVLPGEGIPVDGKILEGNSSLDLALVTGESDARPVGVGDLVYAGTINLYSPLVIRVSSKGLQTRIGKILEEVAQSQQTKSEFVLLLDRVGQAFVVAVLFLSVLGFFLGLPLGIEEAFLRSLAVALIVCPCTFALATPLAMTLAIERCARGGVLVKGAESLERFSHVKAIAFDKTGTLTYGKHQVVERALSVPARSTEITQLWLSLESQSAHPVARAIANYGLAKLGPTPLSEVEGFLETPGLGVEGRVGSNHYRIRRSSEFSSSESALTWVELQENGVVIDRLGLRDEVRPEARALVRQLIETGYSVYLVSGDSRKVTDQVGRELGIPLGNILSEKTPEEKAEWASRQDRLLMVGDGANDALAMVRSYASLAVQGGVEASLQAAGAYGLKPGPSAVAEVLNVSRETFKVVRRNLIFAIVYNGVGIFFALQGLLSPLVAAILMPTSAMTLFLSTIAGTKKIRRAFQR